MKLTFNIDNIKYLKMGCKDSENNELTLRVAFREKLEHEMIAVGPLSEKIKINAPQLICLEIICEDGLYRTNTLLKNISEDEDLVYYTFENPQALDFVQNREYFRINAKYECVYTIETDNGIESFDAITNDISAGGVSIIMENNILTKKDASINVMIDYHNIKSHIRFIRSELFEDSYKLSFEFTDLSEKDLNFLSQMCVNKQLEYKD